MRPHSDQHLDYLAWQPESRACATGSSGLPGKGTHPAVVWDMGPFAELGGALRDFELYHYNCRFFDFGRIWHFGEFGGMKNTPTGCGSERFH